MGSDGSGPKGKISKILFNNLLKLKSKNNQIKKNPDEEVYFANLETSKQKMIRGILGLSKQNVKDIMIPRVDVVTIPSDISIKSLQKIICAESFSRIPVYQNTIDNIIGILYIKDLLQFIIERPKKYQIDKALGKPFFVPESMPLDDLLVEFKKKKQHMGIVVDEYGGFGGIVTMEDILEQIVGDIEDEFDSETPEIHKIKKNMYEVDSRIPIAELNETANINIPTDEFETIGGFVYDLFGEVPKKNETIKYNDISFTIHNIKGARINTILLTLPENSG